MTKCLFTDDQVAQLAQSSFTKNVSPKSITYTDEFKMHFVAERHRGKPTQTIFRAAGLDPDILGSNRLKSFSKKWMSRYKEQGEMGLYDTRKEASGRPRLKDMSIEEKLARVEKENDLLRAELELVKKLDFAERRGNALTKTDKFTLIKAVTQQVHSITVTRACELLEVSRSGYYTYFSEAAVLKRREKEASDDYWRDRIVEAMAYKKVSKGSRGVVMYFKNTCALTVNRKKVQRIMRKYGLVCKTRRINPYKQMAKATQEHRTKKNLLKRKFDQGTPYKVLLTDITYLQGKNGFTGYLSTIIDGATKETLAYYVSDNLKLDLATKTVDRLIAQHGDRLTNATLLHSDQGVHYTSPVFQALVEQNDLIQSMSRRGNCWDNAPQESYFGHLKDEIHYEPCGNLTDLRQIIDDYMTYYNEERGQWKLKKLPPVAYRNQLLKQSA